MLGGRDLRSEALEKRKAKLEVLLRRSDDTTLRLSHTFSAKNFCTLPRSRALRASSANGVSASTFPALRRAGSKSKRPSGVKPTASGTSCSRRRDTACDGIATSLRGAVVLHFTNFRRITSGRYSRAGSCEYAWLVKGNASFGSSRRRGMLYLSARCTLLASWSGDGANGSSAARSRALLGLHAQRFTRRRGYAALPLRACCLLLRSPRGHARGRTEFRARAQPRGHHGIREHVWGDCRRDRCPPYQRRLAR